MTSGFDVFCGLDVGKDTHQATGLTCEGTRMHDAALPNTEAGLPNVFDQLSRPGQVLIVLDQPASIGALPVAMARDCGCEVAHLPGLAMRRIADLHPGQAKTDARDASVIAEAARTMPHTLRQVDVGDEALAEWEVLVGFDDDLASEATRLANRIRGLLSQIHPALERVLGPKVQHTVVLEILTRLGGPDRIRTGRRRTLQAIATRHAPRNGADLAEAIWTALGEQTVTVPGSRTAETVLSKLSESLTSVLSQQKATANDVERILDTHPLAGVLMSMPGIGISTAARILLDVGDGSAFPTPRHVAAYAGLAPLTRRSGSSIRDERPPKGGNKQLKRAFFLAAFAALSDPVSRAYYDRKRAQGKRHNSAPICLARRRCDVLFATLRDKAHYQRPTPQPA